MATEACSNRVLVVLTLTVRQTSKISTVVNVRKSEVNIAQQININKTTRSHKFMPYYYLVVLRKLTKLYEKHLDLYRKSSTCATAAHLVIYASDFLLPIFLNVILMKINLNVNIPYLGYPGIIFPFT